MKKKELDELCINTIRFLSIDQVEKAESGHAGLPMGAAAMAYTLWTRFLRFNPKNPDWPNRDRFVLSAGHGSALLYSLLHLTGYDLPLKELKKFRQWGSQTPGHPEYSQTPGVEATTGPLGQGFANAVGMAIAECALSSRFNQMQNKIVDHYTYVIASDGDLMEGITNEAASLAGHLKLGKLIVLYDNNNVTIEGNTELAFTENRRERFKAQQWHTQYVKDGNDIDAVSDAIKKAQNATERPSFIDVNTVIGFGSPDEGTADAHSDPMGEEALAQTRKNLNWPFEDSFHIPDKALAHFRKALKKGKKWENEWKARLNKYEEKYEGMGKTFNRMIKNKPPKINKKDLPVFEPKDGPMATRGASGKMLNAIGHHTPELMGGSADLAPSNKTMITSRGNFEPGEENCCNMHFGVREHAMGGILNGMALHKGLLPYGGTFLIFSDYMRPPMRLAAMNELPVIYVFTHDSIALGEDGPTHQPVEQLVGLRSIPGMTVIRPADANETVQAWRVTLERRNGPVALILSRQKLPILDPTKYPSIKEGVSRGAYILAESDKQSTPDIILIATGSEVHLAVEAYAKLEEKDIKARLVNMPSWNLLQEQDDDYKAQLFPEDVPKLAIEAGVSLGWVPYVGASIETISVDRFGASAPGEKVLEEYGFTVDAVVDKVQKILSGKAEAVS